MQALAREQNHPRFVAVHGDEIVFTTYEEGAVRKVRKDGSALTTLLEGAEDAYGVAVAGDVAFVAARTQAGAVWRIPLASTAAAKARPTRIARDAFPAAIAVSGNTVAWTTRDTVVRAQLDGEGAQTVASEQPGPHGVAIAGDAVVWSNYHGGSIAAVDKPDKPDQPRHPLRTLASGLANPAGIAFAAARREIVVACTGDGTLRAVPLDRGGGAARTLASGLAFPSEVAVDERFVYFTAAGGVVGKVALTGGAVIVLAEGQPAPTGIAVDAAAVYWADDHAGTIVKLSPK